MYYIGNFVVITVRILDVSSDRLLYVSLLSFNSKEVITTLNLGLFGVLMRVCHFC